MCCSEAACYRDEPVVAFGDLNLHHWQVTISGRPFSAGCLGKSEMPQFQGSGGSASILSCLGLEGAGPARGQGRNAADANCKL